MYTSYNKGFTMFFATLVASLALSIGLAIYDLSARQIALTAISTQSQYAVYAADSGAECAFYWDSKYTSASSSSAFPASLNDTLPGGLLCNGADMGASNTGGGGLLSISQATRAATTTFRVVFLPQPYCADVAVAKTVDVLGVVHTSVTSRGYNTCATGAPNRVERLIQASY